MRRTAVRRTAVRRTAVRRTAVRRRAIAPARRRIPPPSRSSVLSLARRFLVPRRLLLVRSALERLLARLFLFLLFAAGERVDAFAQTRHLSRQRLQPSRRLHESLPRDRFQRAHARENVPQGVDDVLRRALAPRRRLDRLRRRARRRHRRARPERRRGISRGVINLFRVDDGGFRDRSEEIERIFRAFARFVAHHVVGRARACEDGAPRLNYCLGDASTSARRVERVNARARMKSESKCG